VNVQAHSKLHLAACRRKKRKKGAGELSEKKYSAPLGIVEK
jgi:hypothetical protein